MPRPRAAHSATAMARALAELAHLMRANPHLPPAAHLSLYQGPGGVPSILIGARAIGEVGAWSDVLGSAVAEWRPHTGDDGRTTVTRLTSADLGVARLDVIHTRDAPADQARRPRAARSALTVDSTPVTALLADIATDPHAAATVQAAADLLASTAIAAWTPAGAWWRREHLAAEPGAHGRRRATAPRIVIAWWALRGDARFAQLSPADQQMVNLAELIDTGASGRPLDLTILDPGQIPVALGALDAAMHAPTPAAPASPAAGTARERRRLRRRAVR